MGGADDARQIDRLGPGAVASFEEDDRVLAVAFRVRQHVGRVRRDERRVGVVVLQALQNDRLDVPSVPVLGVAHPLSRAEVERTRPVDRNTPVDGGQGVDGLGQRTRLRPS